jgi:hypothetical protein
MRAMTKYGIIHNCNYESTDPILRACKAVEAGHTGDLSLVAALDNLEDVLSEYAESQYVAGREACRRAERQVLDAWTDEVQAEVDAALL